ncbi:hypothetical protein N1028_10705 [Herbiconiux sp. CPCC 203407]|uniref:Uncharacterized protein n=1 Tax=Herbiconiux oxytropis TaxID=2970915 RepID=A0AA41XHH6_9MICO|nr:hypothetical protein [Herbiconiux oxytropis]MCS5722626.1 hypothetical protein [Herbiconiux oxytropis]MCS5726360.1 hypothetical protein [Herbiconiux oxytropis]
MSSSQGEQPLTRRQLREMERQKPRKERDADAKAADEAEAARKAEATGPAAAAPVIAEPVAAEPVAAGPFVAEPATESVVDDSDDVAEDTIVPEVVSDDETDSVDDATRVQPVIEIVPLTEERETVVEEMVIDVPIAATVDPTSEAAAHVEAEEREANAPKLAPLFQSPAERAKASSDQLPSSFDDLISLRNNAATNSISTTSALVLPTVPGSNDVGTALDETGEVIITGSIDLPASFGTLGAPASGLEATDLDALLERSETETQGSDVAPVAASRAISTNTSSTSLIAPPKRARANAPVVLAVTAGVLAVGVVSLLLAVFVFRVF